MKVKTLTTALKLASKISNTSSITSIFKSVELNENSLRAQSEFGNIHLLLSEELPLKSPVLLDTQALLSICSSLPLNEDIVFDEKVNHLGWSCESSKGKLNFVVTDNKISPIVHDSFPWAPPKNLAKALLLSSYACQAAAVSFGLYGITIEPIGDFVHMMSSNSVSLASTKIEKGSYPDKKVTLRPPVPSIFASLVTAYPNCALDICDDGIYLLDETFMAHLPLGQQLDHDLQALTASYAQANQVAKINSSAVKKFVALSKSLTEKESSFTVHLKIHEGRLVLTHQGITSSSEQWMLAEGLDQTLSYESVALAGEQLMLPLESVSELVCDYLKDQRLVLRGTNPDFLYVVGGGN